MKKIVVPYDGSEHARRAVAKAGELAVAFGSSIVLLHAIESRSLPQVDFYQKEAYDQADHRAEGQALLDEAKAQLSSFGDSVETVLLEGDPSHSILTYMEDSDADLLVIGSHGIKGVRRFLLGSVAGRVVHHIDKDVLVVK